MDNLLAKIWEYTKAAGRALDRLLPPAIKDFMTAYPGLAVAVSVAGTLLWGTFQRFLVGVGM